MKIPSSNMPLTSLPFLIHEKTASFSWTKTTIKYLVKHAKKAGIQVNIFYSWKAVSQLSHGSFLVIYGVDNEWLEEVLFHLSPLQLRIILLDGVNNQRYFPVNKVLFNQASFIQDSLYLLRSHGKTRTAFFGLQINDSSDSSKAEAFAQLTSSSDVFSFTKQIDSCFDAFHQKWDQYDSVICSNDLVAAYLIKRCHECHIQIPKQLYLIGNGNLWISSHMSPSLTTYACDRETVAIMVIQLCKTLTSFPQSRTIDISISFDLLERYSTGCQISPANDSDEYGIISQQELNACNNTKYEHCPEIQRIQKLDQILSSFSSEELIILQRLADGNSYEQISLELLRSLDSLKYHIKKMYRRLEIHSRQELIALTSEYQLRFI